ncbi:unnamed protein product [Acanthoscelides obtectus]|uniref:Uncharacterized protein n=1 Tax=Acanthoscelides obtectus TaxID=200917 RepID=A0A9P0K6T4_ACAOB|nr:unnamed protein product [Acanthoscelides obtectus]CAK1671979.1 hypothetical protein AOBTE_LOCUS28586 [Acanthoscelides obtectus]
MSLILNTIMSPFNHSTHIIEVSCVCVSYIKLVQGSINEYYRLPFNAYIMSITFTLSDNSSTLQADFNPPIYLSDDDAYKIGLCDFESFIVIPNVDASNNTFIYSTSSIASYHQLFKLPIGSYEISELATALQQKLPSGLPTKLHPTLLYKPIVTSIFLQKILLVACWALNP